MLFKNFVVFQLRNAARIMHHLFSDPELAVQQFINNVPGQLEDEPEAMSTRGFKAPGDIYPGDIHIEIATDPLAPMHDRIYLLSHVRREKQVNVEGIREKCLRETLDINDGEMDLDRECARRISQAKAIAPIKDTRTPLYLRSDGIVIVGAGLNAAKDVVRDLINAFGGYDGEDETGEVRATFDTDARRFNNRHFHQRCEVLLDRDVFDDDLGYRMDMPGAVCFNNEFTAKLPEKAALSVKNIGNLPITLRPTLHHAEYTSIGLSLFTKHAEYQLKLTQVGEFKSVKEISKVDEQPLRFWLNEMLVIRETVISAMAAPLEEE